MLLVAMMMTVAVVCARDALLLLHADGMDKLIHSLKVDVFDAGLSPWCRIGAVILIILCHCV